MTIPANAGGLAAPRFARRAACRIASAVLWTIAFSAIGREGKDPVAANVGEPRPEDAYFQLRLVMNKSRAKALHRDLLTTQAYFEKRLDGKW